MVSLLTALCPPLDLDRRAPPPNATPRPGLLDRDLDPDRDLLADPDPDPDPERVKVTLRVGDCVEGRVEREEGRAVPAPAPAPALLDARSLPVPPSKPLS